VKLKGFILVAFWLFLFQSPLLAQTPSVAATSLEQANAADLKAAGIVKIAYQEAVGATSGYSETVDESYYRRYGVPILDRQNIVIPGKATVVVIDVVGGRLKHKPIGEGDYPAWSRDGMELGYCEDDAVHLVSAEKRRVALSKPDLQYRINQNRGLCYPDWSPDGQKVVVTAHDHIESPTIEIVSRSGILSKLTGGFGAKWSPDGTKLAFCRLAPRKQLKLRDAPSGGASIWVINADGSNAMQVAEVDSQVIGIRWLPDGTGVAFASSRIYLDHETVYFSKVNLDKPGAKTKAAVVDLNLFSLLSPDGMHQILESDGTIELVDMATKQRKIIAHGIHPAVVWAH